MEESLKKILDYISDQEKKSKTNELCERSKKESGDKWHRHTQI